MRTAIMTDTNSGISVEEGKKLGIYVLPMPINIEDDSYLEGIDITMNQLFECMVNERKVSTSQPSPGQIIDMWNSILEEGYDEIVHIPMTSGLSGSCQSATILAEDFEGKAYVVDNHRISIPQRDSVLEAKRMVDQGKNAKEIKEYLEKNASRSSIYLTVGALKYLQRGGRLSSTEAILGTLLNIKPVLALQGELIEVFAKVRGMKICERKMIAAIKDDIAKHFADVPAENVHVGIAGALQNEKDIEHWGNMMQEAFPDKNVVYAQLPCSILCHLGPDSVGIGAWVVEH